MANKKIDYQALSQELEQLLTELQSGALDVDVALKKYERGSQIVTELETYLKEAENTIKKIKTSPSKKET